MFEMETGLVLAGIAAIIVTILLYVKVMPKKLDGKLNDKLQKLHDFFHFKKLYLEEVLKFIYVLATVATVCSGLFLMLSYQEYWGYYSTRKESLFGYGLLTLIAGPLAIRLAYEGIMMFILLVKNTIEINNKLDAPKQEKPVYNAPAYEAPKPTGVTWTCVCGKKHDESVPTCTCGVSKETAKSFTNQ